MSIQTNTNSSQQDRLFLAVGNSRLHWAWFRGGQLVQNWDTPHLLTKIESSAIPPELLSEQLNKQKLTNIPITLASVVGQQTKLWSGYSNLSAIELSDIKLKNIYATMGIDRALAAWGGGETYGYPCLVIDGGTALTFTGVDKQKQLIGGAILPGLQSQLQTLNQKTAALPQIDIPTTLPPRWALDTEGAIASGIIYTLIAGISSFINDWQQQYPDSQIIFTGGDAEILTKYLHLHFPELKTICDRHLIFWGIRLCS